VFAVACLEAYPFAEDLNIFGVLGNHEVPEFVGVAMAALVVTFGSKQVHDLATALKSIAANKTNNLPIPPAF
jgi:hypothetical protein